jgi:hypothetical protein
MNKLILLLTIGMFYSSASYAHDWDHHRHHGHHGWGHHGHGWRHRGDDRYYPPQVNNYYPQPQVNNYYPEPRPQYYGPQPRNYNYDQRSHQGLAGGVIGSVFGYELGSGDPIAAGLGAAAGSFLGNGFGARY